ncbi:hypothetical protein DL93DRAFT_2077343 [Clavulina sp. PMI_390]|nr:hypothetical protein DL93DRAFT_2077343 [Clavulina sp. PMI_390]
MTIFGPSVDSIIFTVLLAALPTIITHGRRLYASITNKQPSAPPPTTRLTQALSLLVFVHSAYIIYTILFNAPSNIFTALNVPLGVPASLLRMNLIVHSPSLNESLPPQTEALLTRLQSIDVRGYYVRFGHDAVQYCDYCHSFTDFGLFMLPVTGLQYMRTIMLVGLMSIPGSGKRAWRGWFVGMLVLAGLFEAWTLLTVQITITQDGTNVPMWFDRAWYSRHLLFLLLPIMLHILPYQLNPYKSLQAAPYAVQSVESTLSSLLVLEAVRRASLRDDELRKRVSDYYQHDALTSRLAQRDEEIRDEAERAGLGLPNTTGGNDEDEDGVSTTPLVAGVRTLVSQWRTRLAGLLQEPSTTPNTSGTT